MIFDNLENCELYYDLNKNMNIAFDFIKEAVEKNYDIGRYEILGTDVFAFIQEYTTKPSCEGMYEGHKNYIDIQYIVSGTEIIEVYDINKGKVKVKYDSTKDIGFYHDIEKASFGVVESNEYGIFLPKDLHKPGISFGNVTEKIKKIVVKVKV
ncbi:MAG: DUF386 domain-containing protein [Ruminococcaceae bacterium]|nr:DUF386 domain-containing protein [Oscillospiraceae bacterium]